METLQATEALEVNGVVLIPVQCVRVVRSDDLVGACVHACAEPRAIVVRAAGRWRALDRDGHECALEPLLEGVPGLAEVIRRTGL